MPLFPPQLIEIGHESIRPHWAEMKNLSQCAHEGAGRKLSASVYDKG
jgi:hypothetical protein